MKRHLFILISILLVIAYSCKHSHEGHDHQHEHHNNDCDHGHDHEGHKHGHEEPATNNAIVFTKEQASKIDFAVENPQTGKFGQVIKTTAQIQSTQTDEIVISAKANGIVSFRGNSIAEGKAIASGQNLFLVSGSSMADNNVSVRMAEARINFLKAEAHYLRNQELAKDKIVSEHELIQSKGEYETSKAIYDNLSKNFSGEGQTVSSPLAGYIKQLFVGNGQYVDAGQPLVSISQNKSLLIKADVSPKYASLLPYIYTANIRLLSVNQTYSLDELNGELLSFGRSANSDNFLLPVTFQVDNKAALIPGSFVEIYIKTLSEKELMTVPNTALTEESGAFFVYLQITSDAYEKREVKTGVSDGLRTEIISGLSLSDRVVTRGAISVKLAQSAGALDPHAGHVH